MENYIIIGIIVVIIALAGFYIYKSKKSGKKCIGCPYNCSCNGKKNEKGCIECHSNTNCNTCNTDK